jgi:LCP family protein required for cell wall assembly
MVQLKTMRKFQRMVSFIIFLLLAISGVGCNLPLINSSLQSTPIPVSNLLLTPNANNQLLPTPFQPNYEATLNITPQPNTPTPGISSSRMNILFLGSDWRPGRGFRTDVILLVSINLSTGTVSLISFPRDLFVSLPGYGMNRINEVHEYGGIELSKATFLQNFGIQIDHFIMTNFNGFVNIVNSLGGVEVNAEAQLYDTCALPQAVDKYCYIAPGIHYMDGQTALWYVRSRHSTSDIDRLRRAQEVLIALFNRLMNLDAISKAPQIWSDFSNSFETDLRFDQVLSLLPLAPVILSDQSRIHRYAIGWHETSSYIVPENGWDVLLPDYLAINSLLNQAFSQ